MQHFLTLVLLPAISSVTWATPAADPAKLRRIPRIYNAVITSDEELLPSQAYPAVAPVLHTAPLSFAPYYALEPVYAPASYSQLPGFNDTLRDPQASSGAMPLLSLQPQQIIPQVTDQVKNNRPSNPDIPDVPPPPLPVSPPRPKDRPEDQSPQQYPPAPPQGLPF